MSSKHNTYKIQQNDTVNSIAKELDLDVEELKEYHNNKSNFDDRLPFIGIPEHLKEIIIPNTGFGLKDGKEIWLGKGEPIRVKRIQYNGDLSCAFFVGNWSYGIVKTIKNGAKTNTIAYTVNLNYYVTDNIRYVSVDMISDTFINDKEPDLIVDELAIGCTKTLYPIIIELSSNGTLNTLENHNDIMERWQKTKKQLSKYYKGDIVKQYLQHFEGVIKDESLLLHYLQNDWFFYFYFDNIYKGYTNYKKEYIKKVPIIPFTAAVDYQVTQTLHPYLENNYIRIESNGYCIDKRNISDLENKHHFPSNYNHESNIEGNYRAIHMLNKQTARIKYLFVESSLKLNKEKQMSISISEIENTIPEEELRHTKSIHSKIKPPWWYKLIP